eukprot:1141359-Pelagomonas_calceolata.AAC.1
MRWIAVFSLQGGVQMVGSGAVCGRQEVLVHTVVAPVVAPVCAVAPVLMGPPPACSPSGPHRILTTKHD